MNLLKIIAVASVIALANFSANASQIMSGGITWDPDYISQGGDFFAGSVYTSSETNGIVSGFGDITYLNGQNSSQYCVDAVNGCQLSAAYADLANGGTLNFYVNAAGPSNSYAEATAGQLWLSLAINNHAPKSGVSSEGHVSYFDVVDIAGTVASNFDTNTMAYGADIAIDASKLSNFNGWGEASFYGDSIPEPSTLAIFGLALLGVAASARRKA